MSTSKTSDKTSAMVPLASVYQHRATRKETSTTDAAKTVRSQLRKNFDKVCEMSPNVKDHKQEPNDRKPWPKQISPELAYFLEPSLAE